MKKYTFVLILIITGLILNSVSAQTQLSAPTVKSASLVSSTSITANWSSVTNAVGYDVRIYDSNQALVGLVHNTGGPAIISLLISELNLSTNSSYSYTVTAIGDGGVTFTDSPESSKSIPFYIQASNNKVVFQYASADVATLNTDLKSASGAAGSADIYELTTSGGAYTFSTGSTSNNNTLIKNTTIRAKSGLSAKPVLKLSSTTAGSTCNIIYSTTASLVLYLDGLEFDGVNTTGTGQPLAVYTTGANTKLYATNCYFHDFKNVPGNGMIRYDGASTDALIDIQGCTINACGGRILYHNPTASATTKINLKNNSFSNSSLLTSRANIIYAAQINTGTIAIDHCTFYNIVTTSTSEGIIRNPSGSGAITISNSIFSNVAQTLPTATISNCYLAGFTGTVPTGANTIATAPIYTNTAALDFSLTNRASLVGSDGLTAGNASYYPVANPLNTPTTGAATTPTNVGFTANWTNGDSHATSFTVKTYIGGILATTSSASSSSNSLVVTGLMAGVDYTYTVSAVGDGISYGASAESSPISVTTTGRVASVSTDMNDGTWGTALLALPANGAFGTTYVNGFVLSSAVLYTGTSKDSKGISHTNRISLDKSTYGSCIILPTVNSIGQLEIHGSMGTAGNGITVKELNTATNTWMAVGGTYVYDIYSKNAGSDSIYIIPISRNTPTTLKIENASTGSGNVWQVITRTTNPSLLTTPTISPASSITATSFTASWSSVANATNYEIKVYKGTTLKVTANTTAGQATTSLAITGLQADSTYTYKVKALGDGEINYSDSYQSLASASFTMGHQLATPTVGTASTSTTGITANWTNAVLTNVVSYDIKVYQGTTLVKTVNVPDPNATSLNINGLLYATEYTFTVTAVGDNVTYFNSAESAKSTPATTDLGTGLNQIESALSLYANNNEIVCSQKGNIAVYNIQGAKVLEANFANKLTTNLSAGIYMVRFTSQTGIVSVVKLAIKD